ncbi:MAG: class I SAM-dependent methyltransferase [Armatimonadetes bacterium]|nr:class I SAM-dependent methyltransferase [Armatimonadota bacterium]
MPMSPRSMVETSGRWAPYYDHLMNVLFLGMYSRFMRCVTAAMQLQPGDEILDLASGTGRNARLILSAAPEVGRIVGVDISDRMLERARRRCANEPRISFVKQRIEQPLPFAEEFDAVFISLALHGFEDEDKTRIIANAHRALKPGGALWVLDYDEFDLERMRWPVRWYFRHLECELAGEFLRLNLTAMLEGAGFGRFASHRFMYGIVRLLRAVKQ